MTSYERWNDETLTLKLRQMNVKTTSNEHWNDLYEPQNHVMLNLNSRHNMNVETTSRERWNNVKCLLGMVSDNV